MTDVMIDIETLGTKPGSIILSIGAMAFDAEMGELNGPAFYCAIDVKRSQRLGFTMDADTVTWWIKQSPEARAAAFGGKATPYEALKDLSSFVSSIAPKRIWAKPPAFDIVLLEAAYERLSLDIPWDYRALRDCRTLFDITGTIQPTVGTVHNALDDATAQAAGVVHAFAGLNGGDHGRTDT